MEFMVFIGFFDRLERVIHMGLPLKSVFFGMGFANKTERFPCKRRGCKQYLDHISGSRHLFSVRHHHVFLLDSQWKTTERNTPAPAPFTASPSHPPPARGHSAPNRPLEDTTTKSHLSREQTTRNRELASADRHVKVPRGASALVPQHVCGIAVPVVKHFDNSGTGLPLTKP